MNKQYEYEGKKYVLLVNSNIHKYGTCDKCVFIEDSDACQSAFDVCTSGDGGYFVLGGKTEEPLFDALGKQEGGSHYCNLKIQPVEYIVANKLSFLEGNVVKYITRHKTKNGIEDIKKVIHYCELILQLEYNQNEKENTND